MRKHFFILLLPILLFSQTSKAWDDKTINQETLDSLCQTGMFGNMTNGRGYGYMMYIMQGRVAMGNTTTADYNRLKNWFASNCSDGLL